MQRRAHIGIVIHHEDLASKRDWRHKISAGIAALPIGGSSMTNADDTGKRKPAYRAWRQFLLND
jgi:hypothetical protein